MQIKHNNENKQFLFPFVSVHIQAFIIYLILYH